jgi:putative tricarboxylic transport membrane protein
MGGQVDYMCGDIIVGASPYAAGNIKIYAIAAPNRNPALPDVPSTVEAGLPAFQASAWNGLFAPKGTPKPILDQLTNALDKALDDAGTRKRMLQLGSDIPDKKQRGQQALLALVKSEIARWSPIIKAAGVTAK